MRIRLYHARILTMLENDPVFFGEVWVNKDRIERVIPEDTPVALSEERFDQQIDCMGNLLIPGFKNCHAHGPMTFLRSYADDMQLQDWLNQKIFPAEARLQEEDVYTLMQLAVLEYIRGGITTSFEMYFHPDRIAKACKELGYRVVLSGTVFGASKEDVPDAILTD